MAEPFLSEIRIMSFVFAPKGWALCNGQLLPINQNQALFSLLGTTYGGNGQTNFALPNLRGQVPMHVGNGHSLGEAGGTTSVTVTQQQLPQHVHQLQVRDVTPGVLNGNVGTGTKFLAQGLAIVSGGNQPVNLYGTGSPSATLDASSVSSVGGSQAHNNMAPFLTLSFCIALQGIFPSPN